MCRELDPGKWRKGKREGVKIKEEKGKKGYSDTPKGEGAWTADFLNNESQLLPLIRCRDWDVKPSGLSFISAREELTLQNWH